MPAPVYIFGDESGSFPNPHESIITFAAIRTDEPARLTRIIQRIRREIRWQRPATPKGSEFRFHATNDNARVAVLSALVKEEMTIHALSIFKGRQPIEDSPENYAIGLWGLLESCIARGEIAQVTFDTHFTQPATRDKITQLATAPLDAEISMQYVASHANPIVQLADFVAGAIHTQRSGHSPIFYDFIKPRILGDQLREWRDLKEEWFERKHKKRW